MVAYELSLIVKAASKNKLVSTVKRTCDLIAANRGYVEKIEFLGTRALPFKINAHGRNHNRGSYFLLYYHSPYKCLEEMKDSCRRDVDIIRPAIFPRDQPEELICQLHEETKPPAYRADVAKMMQEAKDRMPWNVKVNKLRKSLQKGDPF